MKRLLLIIFLLCLLPSWVWGGSATIDGDWNGSGTTAIVITGSGVTSDLIVHYSLINNWDCFIDPSSTTPYNHYLSDCSVQCGDGSTATTWTLLNESWYFTDTHYFEVENYGTMTLGELEEGWGRNGSLISMHYPQTANVDITDQDNSILNIYGSTIVLRQNMKADFERGIIDIRNSTISGTYDDTSGKFNDLRIMNNMSSVSLQKFEMQNLRGLELRYTPDVEKDNFFNDVQILIFYATDASLLEPRLSNVRQLYVYADGGTLIDPIDFSIDDLDVFVIINDAHSFYIKHVFDPKITNKDGDPISGATVIAIDRSGVSLWSMVSGADGLNPTKAISGVSPCLSAVSIYGTSETKGYYNPYKIEVQANGYKTKTMSGITITEPWAPQSPIVMEPFSRPLRPR